MAIKYQYAYDKDNNIVNISDADKSILYYCIVCNDILIPKQGKRKKWHFCHKHEQTNCSTESYLHKLAKQKFYDIYNNCLENNKPFYIEIKSKEQYHACSDNTKFNVCKKCDYCRTKVEKINLIKWFKNIEIEKTIDSLRADVCLSTINDTDNIFIEIHVSNKISAKKENSKYRIIEIDINDESDLQLLENAILVPSEKVRFINFKTPEKSVLNDNGCKKLFMLLYLNKNGAVYFKDNLSISELNKKLLNEQGNWVAHNIVALQPCNDYADYEMIIDFHNGAGSHIDYKQFIADCANKNLNVKSCFICRYHAETNKEWSLMPIFCKFLKKEYKSTQAIECHYFRKENRYVKDLINIC